MIEVTDTIFINEAELRIDFVQSSGPGGQNVNKVATQAQLRFNVDSPSLPETVRARLMVVARNRITDEGELLIMARQYRTQEQNRQDAVDRLVELIRKAATPPKPRKPTKPGKAAVEKRLRAKKQRGASKRQRKIDFDME